MGLFIDVVLFTIAVIFVWKINCWLYVNPVVVENSTEILLSKVIGDRVIGISCFW